MTSQSVKSRQNRAKHREASLRIIAKLVGCVTVVVAVASVFYVTCRQIWRSPAVDPVYEQMAGEVPWVPLEQPPPTVAAPAPPAAVPIAAKPSSPQPAASDHPVVAAVPIKQAVAAPVAPSVNYEGKRQEIERTIQKFFAAKTVPEKVPFCRDADRVLPLMAAYYQKHPLTVPNLQKLGWLLPVKEPGFHLVFVQALFKDHAPVSLIAEEATDGSFRVDWESSVRYSEIDWKDFLSERPGEPKLFRVIASKSAQPAPAGSSGQQGLEIRHPAEKGTVIAYFDQNDPQFKPLIEQLKLRNWKDVPLTLRLCYPKATKSNGEAVRIAGIEGQGWLILQNTRS